MSENVFASNVSIVIYCLQTFVAVSSCQTADRRAIALRYVLVPTAVRLEIAMIFADRSISLVRAAAVALVAMMLADRLRIARPLAVTLDAAAIAADRARSTVATAATVLVDWIAADLDFIAWGTASALESLTIAADLSATRTAAALTLAALTIAADLDLVT